MTNKWVHCPVCGHRMFLMKEGDFAIEIKCTSCKRIIKLNTKEMENNARTIQGNSSNARREH